MSSKIKTRNKRTNALMNSGNDDNSSNNNDDNNNSKNKRQNIKQESSSHTSSISSSISSYTLQSINNHPLMACATTIGSIHGYTTTEILEEFRRFMTLKVVTKDTNATIISPTPIMDQVWHAAILNTQYYQQLQQEFGLTIHHNPNGALNKQEENAKREKRLQEMHRLYKLMWNEEPLKEKKSFVNANNNESSNKNNNVNNNNKNNNNVNNNNENNNASDIIQIKKEKKTNSVKKNKKDSSIIPIKNEDNATQIKNEALTTSSSNLSPHVKLFIKTLTGRTLDIHISLNSTIEDLKVAIQLADGIPPDQQRLIWAGMQLDPAERLLSSFGIQYESTIHVVSRLKGC